MNYRYTDIALKEQQTLAIRARVRAARDGRKVK